LTWAQRPANTLSSPTNHGEGESLFGDLPVVVRTELEAVGEHRNSNVLKILPVTTLRTIDLEGKKNSDRLFSRFCGKLSVFFEGILAPKLVQSSHRIDAAYTKQQVPPLRSSSPSGMRSSGRDDNL
jgi:hypothetical protein